MQAPINKELRRLDASFLIPPNSHVVFCPPPTTSPTLQSAVDVLIQLSSSLAPSSTPVLFLSDWSAKVLSCCDSDEKAVNAYYDVMVKSLTAFAPEVMGKVKVVRQR